MEIHCYCRPAIQVSGVGAGSSVMIMKIIQITIDNWLVVFPHPSENIRRIGNLPNNRGEKFQKNIWVTTHPDDVLPKRKSDGCDCLPIYLDVSPLTNPGWVWNHPILVFQGDKVTSKPNPPKRREGATRALPNPPGWSRALCNCQLECTCCNAHQTFVKCRRVGRNHRRIRNVTFQEMYVKPFFFRRRGMICKKSLVKNVRWITVRWHL